MSLLWNTVIVDPMINALLFIYSLLGNNFGLSIIVFTLLVRLITHPFTAQQLKSGAALQDLQKSKEWQQIQKKHKNDREKLAQEQMKLYREAGVNPFGACLPTLLQFPIIIGLYQSVIRAVAVTPQQLFDLSQRIYEFFPNVSSLIPLNSHFLWMDLSQPERLHLSFLPFGIPVLAIIVTITGYIQAKLMPTTPGSGEQGAMMGQMMGLYFPLMLGYFSLTFASGLALYFVASNLFTILQYAMLGRLEWRNLIPESLRGRLSQSRTR